MARTFNGTTDLIVADAAHLFSELSAYSVAGWVKAATPAAAACFFSEGRSASASPLIVFICNAANRNKLAVTIRNDAGGSSQFNPSGNIQSTTTFFDGTWHHFVFAQDGSAGTCHFDIYIDGLVDATFTNRTYTPGTTTIDTVGFGCSHRNTNVQFMACDLAHFATWSRQLTASEAASLAAGANPLRLAANHYWPFWGVDSPEPDLGSG